MSSQMAALCGGGLKSPIRRRAGKWRALRQLLS
jgi:hypothetical protein